MWVSAVLGPASRRQDTKGKKVQRAGSLGVLRAAGIRASLILCLPDELFQKVAEDYVSVAAFQVMTGVYSPPIKISSRLMDSGPAGDLPDHHHNSAEQPPLSLTEDKGVDLSQKANPYFYSCCHH